MPFILNYLQLYANTPEVLIPSNQTSEEHRGCAGPITHGIISDSGLSRNFSELVASLNARAWGGGGGNCFAVSSHCQALTLLLTSL